MPELYDTAAAPATFRRRLLSWYRRAGRDLAWRRTRDPYRVLLSEVMLQQTQVSRVLPAYRRFLRRFPTLRALSRAPLGEVLREWSGLGYNRRARDLHR
ncbi:MAG TPA: A/G-specific adenine glycosylase, partial [Thermoplasmata archaeon]|nr:A/G-specific adenine glycosylase [Thermoplasmata archaeon]